MYGDNDKYVKAHASDDQDYLRCETLSEGALCKEGVWQVSFLSQVFATIVININLTITTIIIINNLLTKRQVSLLSQVFATLIINIMVIINSEPIL